MASLVERDTYKAFIGVAKSDTSLDAFLDVHLEQCSARVEEFCNRKFAADDYTEFLCGNGDAFLYTQQRPINSIASIYVDANAMWGQAPDAFAAASLLTAGESYALVKDQPDGSSRRGAIFRINGVWPKPMAYQAGVISPVVGPDVGNIKLTYNAGFDPIPGDLQQAICLLVSATRRIASFGVPTASESWEGYSVSVGGAAATAIGGLPPDTLAVLVKYKNWAIG